MHKNIITVVNFIRSIDMRRAHDDLLGTVKNQKELADKYKMPTTFLFQPDALSDKEIVEAVGDEPYIEKGLWLELNRFLIEEAGCEWRAATDWSWHSHVDLMSGYTPEERIRIADCAMEQFKGVFGYYPETVGSWVIDAFTLKYLEEKYDIKASMNCKDQWFTDGYSLWGGYYNQAFYPCKNNAFTPAQTAEEQINVPIFRMLGSCPIRQYNCRAYDNGQKVISLEPVYHEYGGNREWVEWFFGEMIKYDAFSFGYAQAGQENAFGWEKMKDGYIAQMEILDRLSKEGKIDLLKARDAGLWYKNEYKLTPVSVMQAEKNGENAIWYSTKRYRLGFYADKDSLFIRDIMLFDEKYVERYLNDTCKVKDIFYDNLPIVDSYRWSDNNRLEAGMFFVQNGEIVGGTTDIKTCRDGNKLIITVNGDIVITLDEDSVTFEGASVMWKQGINDMTDIVFGENKLELTYNNFDYSVNVLGKISPDDQMISPVDGRIVLGF